MTGRDPVSVLRSIRRMIGVVLPEPWDVQMMRQEPQTRPLAVVRFVGPMPASGSAYVREYVQPVEIFAYPAGTPGRATASMLEAEEVKNMLIRAIDTGHAEAGSRAMRIPLIDYSAIALDDPTPEDAEIIDYLPVESLGGDSRPDPEQDDMFTVTIDFRVRWRNDGDTSRWQGPKLEGVGLRHLDEEVRRF